MTGPIVGEKAFAGSENKITCMRESDVDRLCQSLKEVNVKFWLVGGWGVDALVGHQTREHHDLDLLVEIGTLERFLQHLDALGFVFAYSWEESRSICADLEEGASGQPTAFVLHHPDGREVDVHVLRAAGDGAVTALWDTSTDFRFLDQVSLSGEGVIAGERVACFTVDMQRKAHTGYQLPPEHWEDLRRLGELLET
jgi:lincosamide nucleotidyltransferase A/C/D/E